jgi:hypothetical protein
MLAAVPAAIDLKSAAHFTILASSTTTTAGNNTFVNGDVGLFPFGSQGIPTNQINGTVYNGDTNAQQAQLDLTAAFDAASPAQLPGGGNVGADLSGLTLVGDVYQSPSGAYHHESIINHRYSASLVWRRRVLFWRSRHRRQRAWPDPADMPCHLLRGRISREKLTENPLARIFRGTADDSPAP